MTDIEEIQRSLRKFRDNRDWNQFHDSKNLASALSIEAAELNELFLWKTVAESEKVEREKLADEIADVLAYAMMLADRHGLNVKDIMMKKIEKNAAKYPIEKSKGSSKKYNEL